MRIQHAAGLMLLSAASSCAAPGAGRDATLTTRRATLGVRTSVPEPEVAEQMELEFNVRWEGRYVDHVDAGGAAALAGVQQGDVLLSIDDMTLFSEDDLVDFLSVTEPGEEVLLELKRGGETNVSRVRATLGSQQSPIADQPVLDWQYASLVQLPRALEVARAEKKKVLVGLSGAET